MAQNLRKLPFFNKHCVLQILKKSSNQNQASQLYVFSKSLVVLRSLLNFQVMVYKGNLFRKVYINKYLIGFKFGEFTHTRKPFNYPIVKKKKKNLRR